MDRTPEDLNAEFFQSAHTTPSTHEEWLLRMCAQLMEREAALVSVGELNVRGRGRRGRRCPIPSRLASVPSTTPYKESSSMS